MSSKPIALAADHAGYALKSTIARILSDRGATVNDLGTDDETSVDYPDFAEAVVREIVAGRSDAGVLVCGSGIGMSIAANRHAGIRAALVHDAEAATLARQHNNANVLVLAGRRLDEAAARSCIEAFLDTEFEGGRHQRRLDKIAKE